MSGPRDAHGGLRLFGHPATAAMIPHLVLRELGVPFDWVHIDRDRDAHKAPDYLKLNPNGLIPVLIDARGAEEIVLYETAAIVWHLADAFPAAGLAPPVGGAARAHAYKWVAWLSATLQPTLLARFYPDRWVDAGNAAGVEQVRRHAEAKAGPMLDQLDAHLAAHRAPWMLGDAFSIVDPYAFTLCRWTRGFAHPARARPALGAWLGRMLDRPAMRRVLADEGIQPPFV
ncbi:MAG: glutathione S-transferase family protein [Burkholderiales bacterium]